jgi:hypothetical protein
MANLSQGWRFVRIGQQAPGGPIDVTRWYFFDAAGSEAFKQSWFGRGAPTSITQIRYDRLTGRVRKLRNELLA